MVTRPTSPTSTIIRQQLDVLGQQEHPLLVVLADLFEDMHALEIRLGGDQARNQDLIEYPRPSS